MVVEQRICMPRLGTRKLHYLLRDDFEKNNLKIGRDKLFRILRSEQMLIRPRKTYTKTTMSKHWLKKHPNLVVNGQFDKAEERHYLCKDKGR
jgi:putative transposase